MLKLITTKHFVIIFSWLAATCAFGADSLAPPPGPIVEGLPVVVVAHPDQLTLLNSKLPELAANKKLVFDMWRNVMLGGQAAAVDQYLADSYTEHNAMLPNGREAFKNYVTATITPRQVPTTIPDLVTLITEGPYVVMAFVSHYPEPDGSGKTYTSTHFEMFRIADGRIAEHWDSYLFRSGEQVPDYGNNRAVPVTGTEGLAQHEQVFNEDPQLLSNKRLAFDLWRHIPEGGREELAELYLDPGYIQHNPNAATGREGFKEYFTRRPDSAIETYLEEPLVVIVAEGDLVVQVLQTDREQNGVKYYVPWFDMFRIQDGLVMEHWDTASKGELPASMLPAQPR